MRALLAALLLASAAPAFAAPARIIVIRHGEKPDAGDELNERGFARAKALVEYFKTNPAVIKYGPPAAIYAMQPKGPGGSVRAIQTVQPLADALNLTIDSDWKKDQLDELVAAVMSAPGLEGKTVLICWEHKVIPAMVRRFGWTTAPARWDGAVFDRAWIIDFNGDRPVAFTDAPEHVLPGDSAD